MSELTCHASLTLPQNATYMPVIFDRLASFQARVDHQSETEQRLTYAFGSLALRVAGPEVHLSGRSTDPQGLARVKDLMATAFRLYAMRHDPYELAWQGDGAGENRLDSFRLMTVNEVTDLTPHMRRIRLTGEALERFSAFGNMHVRLLLPDPAGPAPIWPVAGPDGLPLWPDPDRKPLPRVYTIRRLDVAEGWVDIDMVLHGTEGPGSAWAMEARPGDQIGLIGPLGRPIREGARNWLLGTDETGIPAVARMLESLPEEATGTAFIEVAGPEEEQPIANRTGIRIHWLHRGHDHGHEGDLLAERVLAAGFPEGGFGWFAAEHAVARRVREHWRDTLALGRDVTLCAAYWKRGAAGLMAG